MIKKSTDLAREKTEKIARFYATSIIPVRSIYGEADWMVVARWAPSRVRTGGYGSSLQHFGWLRTLFNLIPRHSVEVMKYNSNNPPTPRMWGQKGE